MSSILLDTHVLIWYLNGDDELGGAVRKKITYAIHENNVHLAAISLWEIGMLSKKQRVVLEMPYLEWINKGLEATRINIVELSPAIANESCDLPGKFHEDPADRMIVATARVENLTLVTRDRKSVV